MMLSINSAAVDYFKPLHIQTELQYEFQEERFPGISEVNIKEPALVVAPKDADIHQDSPGVDELVPTLNSNSSERVTLTSHGQTGLGLMAHFPVQGQQPVQRPLTQQPALPNPHSTSLQRIYPANQPTLPNFINETSAQQSEPYAFHGVQRRLSYGQDVSVPEQIPTNLGDVSLPIPNITGVQYAQRPQPLAKRYPSQSELLPSTVMSCLDPFDDSMSQTRTDGTFSGTSTPTTNTPEYAHPSSYQSSNNITTVPKQPGNPSQRFTQTVAKDFNFARAPEFGHVFNAGVTQRAQPNRPNSVSPPWTTNTGFPPTNTMPYSIPYSAVQGLPNPAPQEIHQNMVQGNRNQRTSFNRPTPLNESIVRQRGHPSNSKKRSADNMLGATVPNSKRQRRDHVEVYGVENVSTEASPNQVPNVHDVICLDDDQPTNSFDEYSCPGNRRLENLPLPLKRGTIHYYGGQPPVPKPRQTSNLYSKPGSGLQRLINSSKKYIVPPPNHVVTTRARNAPYHPHRTNVHTHGHVSHGNHGNGSAAVLPSNVCVTRDTFRDILYSN